MCQPIHIVAEDLAPCVIVQPVHCCALVDTLICYAVEHYELVTKQAGAQSCALCSAVMCAACVLTVCWVPQSCQMLA